MTSTSRLLLAAVLSALPAAAFADPTTEARERFQEGVRLFRASDYAAARAAFEDANRILPNSRILANIAACWAGEGRNGEALSTYRRFLREAGEGVPRRARDEAQSEVDRLRQLVCDIVVVVEPERAEIIVDGRSYGASPLAGPISVEPGEHAVDVRAEGYSPFPRRFTCQAGSETDMAVVLDRLAAPRESQPAPPPPNGATEPEPPPPVGPVPTSPAPTPLGRGPLLWTGIAATGALAVGAAVTGLLTMSKKSEYEDAGTSIERRRDLYDSTATLATVTDVLVDAAIGLGIATVVLYIVAGPGGEAEGDGAVSLSCGAGAPCVVGGRF